MRVDTLVREEHALGDIAVRRGLGRRPAEVRTPQTGEVGQCQHCFCLTVHQQHQLLGHQNLEGYNTTPGTSKVKTYA